MRGGSIVCGGGGGGVQPFQSQLGVRCAGGASLSAMPSYCGTFLTWFEYRCEHEAVGREVEHAEALGELGALRQWDPARTQNQEAVV